MSVFRYVFLMSFLSLTACGGSKSGDEKVGFRLTTQLEYPYAVDSVAAGDLDGNGLPDVVVTAHGAPPAFFFNRAGVNFERVLREDLADNDLHGIFIADMNGDERTDITISKGAGVGTLKKTDLVLLNEKGDLKDQTLKLGLDVNRGRGRNVRARDLNGDGLLDLIFQNAKGGGSKPAFVFQNSTGFDSYKYFDDHTKAKLLINLLGKYSDSEAEILEGDFPESFLNQVAAANDVVVEHFSGIDAPDLVLVKGRGAAQHVKKSDFRVVARLESGGHRPSKVSMRTAGTCSIDVYPKSNDWWKNSPVSYNGVRAEFANGIQISSAMNERLEAQLGNTKDGLVIEREGEILRFALHGNKKRKVKWMGGLVDVVCDAPVRVSYSNHKKNLIGKIGMYQLNKDAVIANESLLDGFDGNCSSVGAADFDNDEDIDLYLSCSSPAVNQENRLYLNDGSGNFTRTKGFGAEGSGAGLGGSTTVADFNADGFMDILVAQSRWGSYGLADLIPNKSLEVFLNNGNENNWLKVRLVGNAPNTNALGSKLFLETGTSRQTRYNDGGLHSHAQNDAVAHFGLGKNSVAKKLKVVWPNGDISLYEDIAVNQLIEIQQPGGPDLKESSTAGQSFQ